jgi:putative Mn2+ efflux pump MntP
MISNWLSILGISLANNLDNTGVGVAYGAAGIRISVLVNLWISVITYLLTGSSALVGDYVGHFLPSNVCKPLSAVILCTIGFLVMRPSTKASRETPPTPTPSLKGRESTSLSQPLSPPGKGEHRDSRAGTPTPHPEERRLGEMHSPPIGRLLEDPLSGDWDGSRHIDFKEGTLLGVALSINNVGGGISAGLLHLSAGWTALLSAVLSFCVLWFGGMAGNRLRATRVAKHAPVLAGALLIAIGLFQLR